MRYKVGDTVVIKEQLDLRPGQILFRLQEHKLLKALGTEVTITNTYKYKWFGEDRVGYRVDKVPGVEFTSNMFEERK